MRLVLSLFCISAALQEQPFPEDDSVSLLQLRSTQSELQEHESVGEEDALLQQSELEEHESVGEEDALLQEDYTAGIVKVMIDKSSGNSKCVKAPVPVNCAVDAGNLGKRVNSHRARDSFEITTNGDEVCCRRTDSRNGWGMHLEIACEEVVAVDTVHVLIDRSGSNTKCVTASEPVTCAVNAANFGNRINNHNARDTFEVRADGAQVCVGRTDSRQGWGMRLEVACTKAPAGKDVNVLIDRSGSNTKCVTAPVAVTCAADAANLGKRVNNHGARDSFEITTNGDRVCARRTDSRNGWGMRLEVKCTEVSAPAKVRVVIDRSNGNSKCVASPVPVLCAADAGNLGNRINAHGARDSFAISSNGAQVCARRTDSPRGWGMRLEVECTEAPAAESQTINVLIDRSGSNTKCVTAPEPVNCESDAGNLGKRINSHGARDTFAITTNGAQVCARRSDSGRGWGMKLEIQCTIGGAPAAPVARPQAAARPQPAARPNPFGPRPSPPPVARPRPTPAPCTNTRRGPFTIKKCPGKKTAISMTMKGFDLNKLDARKRAILDVFRQRVIAQYSVFLRLRPDQIVVEFKAGSAIVIGSVAAEDVADDIEPGDGQGLLADLKSIPGVESLVEEGKELNDCNVDPEPEFPVDDEAAAVGDPHMTLASGGTDDLCCEGGVCAPCSLEDNSDDVDE